jgi:methionyl-tRNA synthetase
VFRIHDSFNKIIEISFMFFLCEGSAEERARAGTVVGLSVNLACLLSVLIQPYMPALSREIQDQLAAPPSVNRIPERFTRLLPPGHRCAKLYQTLLTAIYLTRPGYEPARVVNPDPHYFWKLVPDPH